jgi:hypothetical protein
MIHPGEGDTSTVRSVFVIDPADKIRLMLTYPKSTGRNFDEILRVIDSLQLTDDYQVATPVDWKKGDRVIASPALSTDEARERVPEPRRGEALSSVRRRPERGLTPAPERRKTPCSTSTTRSTTTQGPSAATASSSTSGSRTRWRPAPCPVR